MRHSIRQPVLDERSPPCPGFALTYVVFALSLVGLIASSGFLLAWLERRSVGAFEGGVEAFYGVDGALWEALGTTRGTPPATTSIAVGRTRTTVAFERLLRLGFGEALYRVTATGSGPAPRGGTLDREVGLIAWAADPPLVPAALTAAGDVVGPGSSASISGIDRGAACGGRYPSAIAGLAIDSSATAALGGGVSLRGSPPLLRLSPATTLRRATGVDWVSLTGRHGPPRDAVVPPDPWPAFGGGGPWFVELSGPSSALDAVHSGQGVILAIGDLTLRAGFVWQGLVLVGGRLALQGDAKVQGAVIAGLNPGHAGVSVDLGSGPAVIELDSCAAEAAALRVASAMAPHPGTWFERM